MDGRGKRIVKNVALLSVLIAVAMILSYVEAQIPLPIPIPGVKIGLANLAVIMALYLLGFKFAVVISLVRVVLVALLFGNMMTMAYGLAGATLSLIGMGLLKKIPFFSTVAVSVSGGVLHNIGQVIVASIVTESAVFVAYLPVLLVSGVISGAVIGIVSALIVTRVKKIVRTNHHSKTAE